MKKKYRSTFWSMETGTEWIQAYFLEGGGDDEIKSNVMTFNRDKWKAIEPQVRVWVTEGWAVWLRDKPEWFTENWRAKVPADWVPKEGKEEHKRAKDSVRRMSFIESERKRSVVYAA